MWGAPLYRRLGVIVVGELYKHGHSQGIQLQSDYLLSMGVLQPTGLTHWCVSRRDTSGQNFSGGKNFIKVGGKIKTQHV